MLGCSLGLEVFPGTKIGLKKSLTYSRGISVLIFD